MNTETVSVIIPSYNYGHFLGDCIDSVLVQRHPSIEIVVVDDGSTDNTAAVVSSFGDKVRYIHKENAGLSAARNTGLSVVTGDYVQFLDADDLLHPDALAQRVGYLQGSPEIDIAVCRNLQFSRYPFFGNFRSRWYLFPDQLDVHFAYSNIAPPHAFLCRRQACVDIGLFATELKACEDYDYWLRGLAAGLSFGRAPGLVYYRKHSSSMSANDTVQWEYDVLLHNRAYAMFTAMHSGSEGARTLESYLAFIAGACQTISRLKGNIQVTGMGALIGNVERTALSLSEPPLIAMGLSNNGLYYLDLCRKELASDNLPGELKGTVDNLCQQIIAGCKSRGETINAVFRSLSPRSGLEPYLRIRMLVNLVRY